MNKNCPINCKMLKKKTYWSLYFMPDFYRLVGVHFHVMMTAKCYKKKNSNALFPSTLSIFKNVNQRILQLEMAAQTSIKHDWHTSHLFLTWSYLHPKPSLLQQTAQSPPNSPISLGKLSPHQPQQSGELNLTGTYVFNFNSPSFPQMAWRGEGCLRSCVSCKNNLC